MVRFLVEHMALGGLYMMYPSFPGEVSFSTNHYEVGVHSFAAWHEPVIPNVLRESVDPWFAVPLAHDTTGVQELPITQEQISALQLPIVDNYLHVSSKAEIAAMAEGYREVVLSAIPTFPPEALSSSFGK